MIKIKIPKQNASDDDVIISDLFFKIFSGVSPKHGLFSLFNKSPEIPTSNITKTPFIINL